MSDDEDPSLFEVLMSGSFPRVKKHVKKLAKRADFKRVDFTRVGNIDQVERARRRALEQFDKLDVALQRTVEAQKTEMLWYAMSLLNIVMISMAFAARPDLVPVIYSVELLFLLPIRFWTYYRKAWQFYLADLCYYVNGLLLIYLWVWPQSRSLWISCFAFSYGSLSGSVILWRNSLVLQSIDKTTSSYIHLMPPIVCHCINFRLDEQFKTQRFPGAYGVESWNVVHGVAITTIAYFVWQSLYHYFITVRHASDIKSGTVTSFEFMRQRYAKTRLGKFVNGLPGPLPVFAFTIIQFTFQLVTMSPCPIYYMHEWLSTAWLVVLFAVAAYNGASFYIKVYGQRFHGQLKQLQQELAERDDRDDRDDRENEEHDEIITGQEEAKDGVRKRSN